MVDQLQKKYCSSFLWCLRARSKMRSHELDLSSSKELNLSHFMSLTLWLQRTLGARGKHREQCHIYSIYKYLCISGWKWRRKMTDLKQYWKAENSGHFHPQDLILCLQSPFTHAPGSFGVARSPCIWGSVFHSDITVFNWSRRMLRRKAE